LRCGRSVKKFGWKAEPLPRFHARLRKLHATGRVGRLEPALLFGFGFDIFIAHD
jgi:hypothetical protein